MTTFYFFGGEDSELSPTGAAAVITTAGRFRSNYARCALGVPQTTNIAVSDGWYGALSSAVGSFWLTAQMYTNSSSTIYQAGNILILRRGAVNTLSLITDGASPSHWRLQKTSAAGVNTTLATSTVAIPAPATLTRVDVFVNYAVAGRLQLYVGGTLVLDYSGDVTTDSATTLDGFALGSANSNSGSVTWGWSEIIVADSDTRGMALATLPVNAAGNTQAWSGANTDINETTLNDATSISTTTAAQLAEWTVTPASAITSTTGILAVGVSARAAKGSTGPQNLQAAVRTGATDYTSANLPVSTTLGPLQATWATNPNTAVAWTGADLTAAGFNIGVKSIT